MQSPMSLQNITTTEGPSGWKTKCDGNAARKACHFPNTCPLKTRELPGQTLRLFTCMQCPRSYPWLIDPSGTGEFDGVFK